MFQQEAMRVLDQATGQATIPAARLPDIPLLSSLGFLPSKLQTTRSDIQNSYEVPHTPLSRVQPRACARHALSPAGIPRPGCKAAAWSGQFSMLLSPPWPPQVLIKAFGAKGSLSGKRPGCV